MALPKGAKVFNVVRENMNEVYINTLPSATETNIQTISNILFNENYQPMLNEFVSNLINRIAFTIIHNKTFDNPLSILRKGSVPLGTDIQEIYENPATAEQYEISNTEMAKLLTITDPDTHAAYYRRNRKDLYTKTISRENLQGAFVSWEKFEKYISSITTSLYSGNYIDEFKLTKSLVDGAYANNKAIIQLVDPVTDEASAKKLVKTLRSLYKMMSFPSSDYNAYSKFSGSKGVVETWTTPERVVILITAKLMTDIDVDVLAAAFNIDSTKLMGRIIEVDKFENPNIQAVICDESWFQLYDNLMRFDEFYNARVMAWNEYLHVWQTYAISPFANAVILATENPVPAESISISNTPIELDLGSTPQGEILDITINPDNTTANVTYESSNPSIFTATKITDKSVEIKPVAIGSSELNATTDNGLTAKATVNVINSTQE